jgi:hypothetical protein
MTNEDTAPQMLLQKIEKIDKIEERQKYHAKEIQSLKDVLHSNELDGRLTKVEKRQEFILDKLKDIDKDIRAIDEKCDKQRTTCMGAVAPISLVADLKNDLKRMEERIQIAYDTTRKETREALDVSGKWTRWAFVLSMIACVVSSVSVLVCVNVLIHLPK